jgi:hypothetical protein
MNSNYAIGAAKAIMEDMRGRGEFCHILAKQKPDNNGTWATPAAQIAMENRICDLIDAAFEPRVKELLVANNDEVERRRRAEREALKVPNYQSLLLHLERMLAPNHRRRPFDVGGHPIIREEIEVAFITKHELENLVDARDLLEQWHRAEPQWLPEEVAEIMSRAGRERIVRDSRPGMNVIAPVEKPRSSALHRIRDLLRGKRR